MRTHPGILFGLAAFAASTLPARALDADGDSLNDIWELVYGAGALAPAADADGDGFSNATESAAGTNPFDRLSVPRLEFAPGATSDALGFNWATIPGKRYRLQSRTDLAGGTWLTDFTSVGTGATGSGGYVITSVQHAFFRLQIDDLDSDGDGLTDYEELQLRFNPYSANTDRFTTADLSRVTTGLAAASTITVSAIDPSLSERWPEPGVVAVRRSGGLKALTVNLTLGGTATPGADFTTPVSTSVAFPLGAREAWIEFAPLADAIAEPAETITVTLAAGTGYTIGAQNSATLTLADDTGAPSPKEAARFLIQAAFGPDQDAAADPDDIPENVEEVAALGFNAWIDDQFTRPVGLLQPMTEWVVANGNAQALYTDPKQVAWWGRVMGAPKLTPASAGTQTPDPLRQRVAFALSEILVISDRPEALAVEPAGMANYYDVLEQHAFGNYRDLLEAVALHPCMGIYLSHCGNRKADPAEHIFPDENFAREVMQLFSIGLWKLNPDGTRQLDGAGQPIPTYSNADITELARVFTGLGMGGPANTNFNVWPRDFTHPMKMWDDFHDCAPKTLLGGLALPARTPSAGSTGTAGHADVTAAVNNLFNHPNVGPFLGLRLIQRLVTSNPSPAYVARVAAAFADNGSGVRGDMKAVIKAVLLDPDARSYAKTLEPAWGRLREPFLRVVNYARAFNARSPSDIYALASFDLDHAQQPLNSPSVFNFFLPAHSPPGAITQAGLTAPEFQIVNAGTAISASNYFWNSVWNGLHRWGVSNPAHNVTLDLTQEMLLVVPAAQVNLDMPTAAPFDPDPLIRRLDLALTGGTLAPQQYQIIRETLARIPRPSWQWHKEYLRTAIYLVVTSPDFCVQR